MLEQAMDLCKSELLSGRVEKSRGSVKYRGEKWKLHKRWMISLKSTLNLTEASAKSTAVNYS